VLTQPMDEDMNMFQVEAVMRAEYQLLCQCDGFKTQFDAHAKESAVHTIPRKLTVHNNYVSYSHLE
jgi:hypothetical protein